MSGLPSSSFSTAHLDYLQRNQHGASDSTGAQTVAEEFRLWQIEGMARLPKKDRVPDEQQTTFSVQDILSGLYGSKLPLVFMLTGTLKGISVVMGTWRAQKAQALASVTGDNDVLRSLLTSLYPAIRLKASDIRLHASPTSGFVMGIPSHAKEGQENKAPFDRLVRAMSGTTWAAMVLAQPIEEAQCMQLRDALTNEMRNVLTGVQDRKEPSPLANQYVDLLTIAQKAYSTGLATGMWRTGVYLLGSRTSYPRLASVWRSIFSGEQSQPEAIRVTETQEASAFAERLALPNDKEDSGPGLIRYPYRFQTVLNSSQLALYTHLPQVETTGFAMITVPDFDIVPPSGTFARPINLGSVIERGEPINSNYVLEMDSLTRHVFVAGVTGAGKTNTIFHLLKEAAAASLPFLVIEPAKTEYRALLNDEQFKGSLRVFTLGNERVSPFRLNPFEVFSVVDANGDRTWPVALHLDLLRSVFSASFGMWNPLPQVMEQCLHAIYEDRGWDIASGLNWRLSGTDEASQSFPTLTDLLRKVEEITPTLGYDEKIAADIRAALRTRINSLRTGGKGRMLDVVRSVDMAELLSGQVVLELENLGDDDDKAFVMGLLFIRLIEFRRIEGQHLALRHLVVIEEAHRLLMNVTTSNNQEEGNPKGKAVETFTGLLSEIRSYGQGIVIADQVPVRLAPDVIKNSSLKISHRIVAADDRAAMAGAMSMDIEHSEFLTILAPGCAAVFSDGDDRPLLVKVKNVKSKLGDRWPTDAEVADHVRKHAPIDRVIDSFPLPLCAAHCPLGPTECLTARAIVEDPTFQQAFARLALSAGEDHHAPVSMWPDVMSLVRALRPHRERLSEPHLLQCVAGRAAQSYAERRGAQRGWSYMATQKFADLLREILTLNGEENPAAQAFRDMVLALHERPFDPYPACSIVCQQITPAGSSVCLYRHAVADVIDTGQHDRAWKNAGEVDTKPDPHSGAKSQSRTETWGVCQDAAVEIIQWPLTDGAGVVVDAARRTALCFAQQMLARDGKPLFVRERTFSKIFAERIPPHA